MTKAKELNFDDKVENALNFENVNVLVKTMRENDVPIRRNKWRVCKKNKD